MPIRLFVRVTELLLQVNAHLKLALRCAVAKGLVVQVKGQGASGSFKLPVQKTKAEKTSKKALPKKTAPKKKTLPKPKTGMENAPHD